MNIRLRLIVLPLLFLQCSVLAQHADSIVVLPQNMPPPLNAIKLGQIKAGNNATTMHCDYEQVVRLAKEKAAAMGGNVVKITQIIAPAFVSKCCKIKADVYRTSNIQPYLVSLRKGEESASGPQNYALLCLYRLKDTIAFAGSYNVHRDNDTVIGRAAGKWRDSVKLTHEGTLTLWAETGKRTELKLNIQNGNTYYVRCGLVRGEIRMTPVLELMDVATGAAEYRALCKNKKDMDAAYLRYIH